VPQLSIHKFIVEITGLPNTDIQTCRRIKPQSETARPANNRDVQKARGKNISNRNQGCLASSEPSSSTTVSPEKQKNTPEKQDSDLKSHLMMMIEGIKDINNFLKIIQENTGKQLEALKEETQKSLKDLQENTTKQ
jgi:cell division protein FtsI/penicillin-binding protein 2